MAESTPGKEPRLRALRKFDYAVYALVRVLICAIQALPLSVCELLARRFGWLCWHVIRLRRQVVEENLAIAFPEKSPAEREQIALGMWRHLLLMVMEIAHAPRKVHRTNWRDHSSSPRMKEVLARLIDERPTVLISGHLGNFEVGGFLLALHGFQTHTIARPLDNPYLDKFVNRFRGSTGQHMLPKKGSSRAIALLLERGGTLVLLGDQHAGSGACWVDFFGKPASTHKAVALFTLSGKAPTTVCAALRKSPLHIEMQLADTVDPLDHDFRWGTIPLLTAWYTKCLEDLIRQSPEQYWWVHRRWKGQPQDRRALRRRNREQRAA
jgi:KDO2-lipid IV(A) lauroyltransferase